MKIKIVRVKTKHKIYEGKLLESYDPEIILIKLENGYNIGLKKKEILSIEEMEETKIEEKETKIEQNKSLKKIAIIATGGTIASKVDYSTGGVTPVKKPEDLLESFPELKEIAQFEVYVPFVLDSSQVTSREWKKLAKICANLLNREEIKGVVILHGTDTLHYTAAALSFMLQNLNKPVVFTFAQRSIDRGSSDAYLNLKCACLAALSDIAEVLVVGHEDMNDLSCIVLRGTKTRKMHSTKRAAFQAINDLPIARIYHDNKIEMLSKNYKKRNEKKKVEVVPLFEDKVALIKFFPGASPEILEYFIKKKYRGIVIEAFGLGQISESWIQRIKKACKKCVICITTQTIHGKVDPYVYAPARKLHEAGALFLEDMISETAYVKLGWLLGQYDLKKVKELMLKNLANEVNMS
ncbi:MAG: Glu-tRNA(Gln) amidotransferase subunit GatD [Candidatus Pacearchaeota archaeon]|nr:Glu-tRNA(Gln) amidotransferase subunit GatD [Candidatus Pacearchaeota archaeon]